MSKKGMASIIDSEFSECPCTVTDAWYSCVLWNKLILAILIRGTFLEGDLILYENDWLHTVSHTRETFQEPKSEAFDHPAYITHLALSDFHLLGPLNEVESLQKMLTWRRWWMITFTLRPNSSFFWWNQQTCGPPYKVHQDEKNLNSTVGKIVQKLSEYYTAFS
jgi:hypothetical protein